MCPQSPFFALLLAQDSWPQPWDYVHFKCNSLYKNRYFLVKNLFFYSTVNDSEHRGVIVNWELFLTSHIQVISKCYSFRVNQEHDPFCALLCWPCHAVLYRQDPFSRSSSFQSRPPPSLPLSFLNSTATVISKTEVNSLLEFLQCHKDPTCHALWGPALPFLSELPVTLLLLPHSFTPAPCWCLSCLCNMPVTPWLLNLASISLCSQLHFASYLSCLCCLNTSLRNAHCDHLPCPTQPPAEV